MERVDHIDIVEVGGGCLVCYVYGVFQREVPDWEGLVFGVSRLDAAFVLMVELAQTDSHLAAAWSWSCYHDERTSGLDVVVLAETVFRVYECNIVRIAFDDAMVIHLDSQSFQAVTVSIGARLTVIMGDNDAVDHESAAHELVAQTQHVDVVGDAEVAAHLVLLDVDRADDDDNLRHVG